jgi:hypothetical protein
MYILNQCAAGTTEACQVASQLLIFQVYYYHDNKLISDYDPYFVKSST